MAHRFKFTVDVVCERRQGKFIARADMEEAIREELENADLTSVLDSIQDGTEFEVTELNVTTEEVD